MPLLPWDELWAALGRQEHARRHGDVFDQAAVDGDVKRLREELGLLGCLLLRLALDTAGADLRRMLDELTAEPFREAWVRAGKAAKLAQWAAERIDALEQRVRELEAKS